MLEGDLHWDYLFLKRSYEQDSGCCHGIQGAISREIYDATVGSCMTKGECCSGSDSGTDADVSHKLYFILTYRSPGNWWQMLVRCLKEKQE